MVVVHGGSATMDRGTRTRTAGGDAMDVGTRRGAVTERLRRDYVLVRTDRARVVVVVRPYDGNDDDTSGGDGYAVTHPLRARRMYRARGGIARRRGTDESRAPPPVVRPTGHPSHRRFNGPAVSDLNAGLSLPVRPTAANRRGPVVHLLPLPPPIKMARLHGFFFFFFFVRSRFPPSS